MLYHTLYYNGSEAPRTIRVPKIERKAENFDTRCFQKFVVFSLSFTGRAAYLTGDLLFSLPHTTGSLLWIKKSAPSPTHAEARQGLVLKPRYTKSRSNFLPRWHRATFLPAVTYPPITLPPGDIILITAEKYCAKCRNGCGETGNHAL